MTQQLAVFTSPAGEAEVLAAYEAVLRKWPVPYEELDVPTSFGLTHVIASGPPDAPPIVLLHALFATATSWYLTASALAERYRTYAVDLSGDPNKSRPTRRIRKLDDYAEWFRELIEGLDVPQTHLVGNSVGGFVAAYCAMRLPERIRRLVLIAPAATFHSMPAFYAHMFIPKLLFLLLPWMPGRERAMRRAVDWMRAGLASDGPWDALFKLTMVHGKGTSQVFPRVYSAEELARIQAPTLLLVGDREKIYSATDVTEAARRLMPTLQCKILPQAHHIAAVAQPHLVSAELLEFFDGPIPPNEAEEFESDPF